MRRPFTLIELIISLALASTLLLFLFGTLSNTRRATASSNAVIEPIRKQYAVYQRLAQIMPEIVRKNGHFYTDNSSLVFTYNNGIDEDPKFSSIILARLYLDSEKRLILATWPSPHRWQNKTLRTEILATNIETLLFHFFDPPYKEIENPGWHSQWEKEDLPALIKITINDKSYTFPIIAAGKPIRSY